MPAGSVERHESERQAEPCPTRIRFFLGLSLAPHPCSDRRREAGRRYCSRSSTSGISSSPSESSSDARDIFLWRRSKHGDDVVDGHDEQEIVGLEVDRDGILGMKQNLVVLADGKILVARDLALTSTTRPVIVGISAASGSTIPPAFSAGFHPCEPGPASRRARRTRSRSHSSANMDGKHHSLIIGETRSAEEFGFGCFAVAWVAWSA